MTSGGQPTEERVGALIVDGQRCEIWVRSEEGGDGAWHNAIVFRRDGKLGPTESHAGVDWHLPPGAAHARALAIDEQERLELYQRALRPRPPLA